MKDRSKNPDFEEIVGGWLFLVVCYTNRLHRNRNIQAQDRFIVLVKHLATNRIFTGRRALEKDCLLLNLDNTPRSGASQSVDINTSRTERQVNNAITAKITRFIEHGNTQIRPSQTPSSTSNLLIQITITYHSSVQTGDNRVVDDSYFGNMSMVVRIVTNLPSNQSRFCKSNLL